MTTVDGRLGSSVRLWVCRHFLNGPVWQIPDATIIERISNRWIHSGSGRTYSYDYNPPKVKGIDDVTGETLMIRCYLTRG
jgi:hypothetical protein